MEMMMPTNEPASTPLERKAKAEKWAADVEKNRQKQLAESKSKKKPATKKKPVEMTDEAAAKIVSDIKTRGVYNGEPKPKKVKVAKIKI
jgi:hypothetical protein